jgi:CRISPR-associated protein (TIGR03984 family)
MKQRTIEDGQTTIELYAEDAIGSDPMAWLAKQAKDGMVLLAHADDGVSWGQVKSGGLSFPTVALHGQPVLRKETLQMARLFDSQDETYLWRTGEDRWRGRQIRDGRGERRLRYFDEAQILWGTRVEAIEADFVRVAEGEQGLRHAPPLKLDLEDWQDAHPLRLGVRHYLTEDDEGWLRVSMSRLTGVRKEG